MKKDKDGFISELDDNEIFVFGSNLAGLHIGGAARTAKDKFGAEDGFAFGLQGQSFAIPTLDKNFQKLPLDEIREWLESFAIQAEMFKKFKFYLTPIGTGIAGFSHEEIKSILPKFPKNVIVDKNLK